MLVSRCSSELFGHKTIRTKKVTTSDRSVPVSCHAALDRTKCAPISKERRMKFANATGLYRKSGGRSGPAVIPSSNKSTPKRNPALISVPLRDVQESL